MYSRVHRTPYGTKYGRPHERIHVIIVPVRVQVRTNGPRRSAVGGRAISHARDHPSQSRFTLLLLSKEVTARSTGNDLS